MKKKAKKKYRLRYQSIIIIILILYLLFSIVMNFLNKKITNIYVLNNSYLTDQQIIELAGVSNYPSTITNTCKIIKNKLLSDIYIKDVKVYKKNLTEVYIDVVENRPLFYNSLSNKTILYNSKEVDRIFNVPTLINYVPDLIYEKFLEHMTKVDTNILSRISEIEYNPNEVDDERFLLTMSDNNYVYLTLYKFENINSYIEIIKNFENKKGILYLDSGEYFKVIKE